MTARQEEFLDAITSYHREHGFPPTMEELTGLVGVVSKNSVFQMLKRMVRYGYLMKSETPGKVTHYVPAVPAGHCPCCGQEKPKL